MTLDGQEVRTGDILHGDANGVVIVPREVLDGLPEAVQEVRTRERATMDFIKAPSSRSRRHASGRGTRAACVRAASVAGCGMAPRPSADFRERLVAALDAGLAPSEAARLFGVDRRTVFRWRARHRRGESLAEQPRSGRPPKLDPARYEQLRAVVLTHPDATLPEHAARLARRHGRLPQPLASESAPGQARAAAEKRA